MARRDRSKQATLDLGSSPGTDTGRDPGGEGPAPEDGGDAGPPVRSVSELNALVKGVLEGSPVLQDVWVRGEVSNFHKSSAGHMYFTLKDEDSEVKCVFFRGNNRRLRFDLEDGLQVLVRGNVGVYEVRGDMQLYVTEVSPEGKGELYVRFLQLRERLEAEGLFDDERKRPLPAFPMRVGIVTSGRGAAVQDIIDVATRRFPLCELVLRPVRVQGDGAGLEVAEAIRHFDAHCPVDVLIVGRGGGSIEDLWAFNEEIVARAIAACGTPVVSAVGHETDFTIADFVADARAPTPSAAAELTCPDGESLRRGLVEAEERLGRVLRHRVERNAQRLDELTVRLEREVESVLESKRRALGEAARVLDSVSPLRVLERGFGALARGDTGEVVRSVSDVAVGDPLRVRLRDGSLQATVDDVEPDGEQDE